MNKICVDCGAEFDARTNQIRCPECQKKLRNKLRADNHRRKRLYNPIQAHELICGHYDCIHAIARPIAMCNYLCDHERDYPGEEIHSRPCPPTKNCTCYIKR